MSLLFELEYFEPIPNTTNGKLTAKCLLCVGNEGKRVYKYAEGVTSNLTTHLKKQHKRKFAEYENEKENRAKRAKTDTKKKDKVQMTINQTLSKCSQEVANKKISNLIVNCGLPLTLVQKPEFQSLISTVSSGACRSIHYRTLLKNITEEFDEKMKLIRDETSKVKYICSTADVWSNRKRSFMGMTCHLIDPETLTRKSFPIACDRFKGKMLFWTIFYLRNLCHEK